MPPGLQASAWCRFHHPLTFEWYARHTLSLSPNPILWPGNLFMAAPSLCVSYNLTNELNVLVLEQIRTLKRVGAMKDSDLFEYHLRHYQIMALYHELDRAKARSASSGG